jgi:hypothetical protein
MLLLRGNLLSCCPISGFSADYVLDIVGTSGSALAAGLISSGGRLLKVFCSVFSAFMVHDSFLFVCTLEHSCFS